MICKILDSVVIRGYGRESIVSLFPVLTRRYQITMEKKRIQFSKETRILRVELW